MKPRCHMRGFLSGGGGIVSVVKGILTLALALLVAMAVRRVSPWFLPKGAWGTFYGDTSLGQRVTVRPFRELTGYYPGRPARGVPSDGFSLRVRGWLWVPESERYIFASLSDDGIRMYIDGVTVLDRWQTQSWATSGAHGTASLSRGWHRIETEFFDHTDQARFRVEWAGGRIPPRTRIGDGYLWKVRVPWRR